MKEINLETYNAESVVSVKIKPKEVSDFEWVDYRKGTFFKSEIKAGIYKYGMYRMLKHYTKEEIFELGYLVEGNKIFMKPKVIVSFADGEKVYKKYDTYEEAKEVYEILKGQIPKKLNDKL